MFTDKEKAEVRDIQVDTVRSIYYALDYWLTTIENMDPRDRDIANFMLGKILSLNNGDLDQYREYKF